MIHRRMAIELVPERQPRRYETRAQMMERLQARRDRWKFLAFDIAMGLFALVGTVIALQFCTK